MALGTGRGGGGGLDRLGNSFGTGIGDAYAVAMIFFAVTSDLPAADGVRGPSATLGGSLEYQYLGAWGCEWGAVEIKGTVQLGLRGEGWVRCVLIWDGWRSFRVKVACERSRSQRFNRTYVSQLLRPATR